MAKEIERKFLVKNQSYKDMAVSKKHICQGYLCREPERTVRIRIQDDEAMLTVKGCNRGYVRDEWEYRIPVTDARQMLALCQGNVIEKTRFIVMHDNNRWEVDEFTGKHAGLVVAEIELPEAETSFSLPRFIGREVTGDPRYYNSNL